MSISRVTHGRSRWIGRSSVPHSDSKAMKVPRSIRNDSTWSKRARSASRMAKPWVSMSPPVVQAALLEQARLAESLEAVTRAEDHHALPHAGKGEKVDLVLGDEHAGDAGTQRRGAFGIEGDILFGSRFTGCRQQGMSRIQHPVPAPI